MVANFLEKGDRDALCKYDLTGELLPGEVGSVVMFSLPAGYSGNVALNESVFQAIDFNNLITFGWIYKFENKC